MDVDALDALDALQRDPYPRYAQARRSDGLTNVPELDAWLVARYADVQEVLNRPSDFSSANALRPDITPCPAALAEMGKGISGGSVVLTTDGERHRRYRDPHTRGLSPARVITMIPFITERVTALIDGFAPDGEVELMSSYAERLPGEVIGRLLGLDPDDVPAAVHASRRAEQLLFRPLDPDDQVAAARDSVALQHLMDDYARRHREDPRSDLCTDMIRALCPWPDEPTAEQRGELVSTLVNVLLAGHLTTTALIGTALLHLLRHRDQWELLCERPELIPGAVEEAARFDAPIQGFRRVTTRDAILAGTRLPAGTDVFVAFGSANRDKALCDRPDTFDITRPSVRHLAFGHGVHSCPGSRLARAQVRITLEKLTRRLPGLRLAPERDITMRPTLIHRSPEELPLVW
ncbi:cytochrome P450 [Nocardiopsis gilva YIM 90087]|uniref:Cytochrome P450 n=1 Tax=Nocardiopsis gilva YIM 90087 TaxID=1235441 RepID=A0A223S009_9ACTN|nr:cytochrome P450 [Nocardiopsis gilva YIM 90087]